MKKNRERGAIVVEASISLFAFVFLMFTLLGLVNVVYIQARVGTALHSAAKEISQYSYLYYALGVDGYDKKVSENTADHKETAVNTIKGVEVLVTSLSGAKGNVENGDFSGAADNINTSVNTVEDLVNMYGEQIGDDPKAFILGMGKMALNEVKEEIKAEVAGALAKAFMGKNLKATKSDSADRFLKHYRVVGGMSGLDFDGTSFLVNGESDQILLCVSYDVSVLKLLNIDFKFKFKQVAITKAWDNGICKIADGAIVEHHNEDSTYWDEPIDKDRGDKIIADEKAKYEYTGSRNFHAYVPETNEFVYIKSVNTHDKSYQTASGIFAQLNDAYNSVSNTPTKFNTNKGQMESDKETRKYKLVLVIPADSDMTAVNEAVRQIKEHAASFGDTLEVEINKEYGSPTVNKGTNQEG